MQKLCLNVGMRNMSQEGIRSPRTGITEVSMLNLIHEKVELWVVVSHIGLLETEVGPSSRAAGMSNH